MKNRNSISQSIKNHSTLEIEDSIKRFTSIVPLPTGIANLQGDILYVNQKFIDVFGYEKEEIPTIEQWSKLAYPDEEYRKAAVEIWSADIMTILDGKKENPPVREYKVQTKEGITRNIEISFHIDQELIIVLFNDITLKKKIEGNLRKQVEVNRRIVQTSPLGIFSTNKEGEITFLNKVAKNILFIEDEANVIGKSFINLEWELIKLDGSLLAQNEMPFNVVKSHSESVYNVQHGIIWKNGKKRFFEINASPVLLNNIFDGMVATVEDITEKLKEEEQIRITNQQLKETQSLAKLGSWINKTEPAETIWSDEIFRIFGYKTDEMSPREIFQKHIHPDDKDTFLSKTMEYFARSEKNIPDIEFRIIDRNSQIKYCVSRGVLNFDEAGTPIGAWGTIQDITESKNNELKLKELNDTKDKIFSIIGHDLRNPVSAIAGLSDHLVESSHEYDLEQIKFYADLIRKSSINSLELLLNLLDWAQTQKGRSAFHPEKIVVNEIVDEIIEFLSVKITEKDIEVMIDITPGKEIIADRNMISTVFRNLIANALKYTKKGGKLKITLKEMDNLNEFCISDNGIGISAKKLKKLFSSENYISTPGTEQEKGTGLGLLICKDFIEKHKGAIYAESEINKGTQFYFTIPS